MGEQGDCTTWFLAQLKPNGASIAERNLRRQGFRIFVPRQQETRRARGRFITRLRPLFPGYIFVALDLVQGGWRAVNSTCGISRLVCFGREPAAVPADIIDQLMLHYDGTDGQPPPKQFKPGDRVTLTGGPFTEFVATIESIAPDQRLYLLMELMGAQTRITVDAINLNRRAAETPFGFRARKETLSSRR